MIDEPLDREVPVAPKALPPESPLPSRPQLPRVWPVLIMIPLTVVATVIFQVLLSVVFVVVYVVGGESDPDVLMLQLTDDMNFTIATIFLGQVTFLAASVLAGVLSPQRIVARLGLGTPNAPLWSLALMMVGTGFIWGLVMIFFPVIFAEPSEHLVMMQELMLSMARTNPFLLIVAIVVLPPIVEELLVRGYLQRRLTTRWGPIAGITLATIGFALLHLDPQHMVSVVPVSIWLGFLAWRTDSIYPAILCHGAYNGLSVGAMFLSLELVEGIDDADALRAAWEAFSFPMTPFMLVTGVALVLTILLLMRRIPPLTVDQS